MLRFRPGQNLLPLLAFWFFPLLTVFGHLSMSGSFSLNRIPFGVLSFEKRSETSLKEFSGIGYTVQLSRIGAVCLRQLRYNTTVLNLCQAFFKIFGKVFADAPILLF